jgi:hypothetical protein
VAPAELCQIPMLILYPGHAFEQEGKDNLLRRIMSMICIVLLTVLLTVIVSSLRAMTMTWHPLQLPQGLVTRSSQVSLTSRHMFLLNWKFPAPSLRMANDLNDLLE